MDAPNVTAVLNQLLVRYRRGAALHVGLSTSLGLGCVGLVAWRLWLSGVGRPVLGGVAAAGLLGIAAWQWHFLRRERLNRRQLVAQLDEALGLKARLLTAVEFANAPEPPALYARLLEETATALPAAFRRLPPVVDRRMVALAVVLLLLWLWPRASMRLTQLAMHPPSVMPPPESPPPPQPDQPPPSPEQRQDRSATAQDRSAQGGGSDSREQSQSPSGQAGQTGGQDSTQDSSQTAQTSPSQSDRGSQPDTRQAQQPHPAQTQASSASQDQGRQDVQQQQQQQQRQQQQTSASQQREQSGRAGKTGQASPNAAATKDHDAAGRESGAKQQLAKLSQAAGAQQQMGSSAQQELLKGDIQQLLKELSAELKQMQAELEAAQRHDQPNPAPGTSTDPNLYGDSAEAKQSAGNRLPVQLEVDTQPTASTRRGGGVGKPSTPTAVGAELPQQQPEEASLSDVRTTETGVAPQSIPPEYRPVFERLSRE